MRLIGTLSLVLAALLLGAASERIRAWLGPWMAKSRLRILAIVIAVVAFSLAGAYFNEIGGPADDPSGSVETALPSPASFADHLTVAQDYVNSLRIGTTTDELGALLGPPRGRFPAPENPYGIVSELVYESPVVLMQFLIGEADSIEYFAVTAKDSALRLETPIVVERRPETGEPTVFFVLNETPIRAFAGENPSIYGFLGVSWMNFALVHGGGTAHNWQHHAVGINLYGNWTSDGRRARYGAHLPPSRSGLYDALYPPVDIDEVREFDWENDARHRQEACIADFAQGSMSGFRPDDLDYWIERACQTGKLHAPEEHQRILKSDGWQAFLEGTADTFAVSAPSMFLRYPTYVFFSIWDLGPTVELMPIDTTGESE